MKPTILDYYPEQNIIVIDLQYCQRTFSIEINRAEFEAWLKQTDRLSWTQDHADHLGEHQQKTGVMSPEEYWNLYSRYIKQDLLNYVKSNPVQYAGSSHLNCFEMIKWTLNEKYYLSQITKVA